MLDLAYGLIRIYQKGEHTMRTNRTGALLAFLAIVLALTIIACDDGSSGSGNYTQAQVKVYGTADTTSRAASGSRFASADISVGGENVTNRLRSTGQSAETNDTEFSTTVNVAGDTVRYTVSPRTGFVFDEWKIPRSSRAEMKRDYPDSWRQVMAEIASLTDDDSQTIYIRPEYIKYIRPTFDRGVYFDPEKSDGGDGSAAHPFSDIDDILKFLGKPRGYDDDDELTIKMRKGIVDSFDISSLMNVSSGWGDDEREIELKIIGGYDDDWNRSERTEFKSFNILPPSGGYPRYVEEIEVELEMRNIEFTTLDYRKLNIEHDGKTELEVEVELRNCKAKTLTEASGKVVNGLIVTSTESTGVVFVNSNAPYSPDNSYFHSIVHGERAATVNGMNNIVVGGSGSGDDRNLYLSDFSVEYRTDDRNLISQITQANPLNEELAEAIGDRWDGDDDDLLEEDIVGRERFLYDDDDDWLGHRSLKVSYGPYEYFDFDD